MMHQRKADLPSELPAAHSIVRGPDAGPMGVGVLRAPAGLTQPTSLPGDRYFSHASVPSTSEQNDGTIKAQAPV